MDSVSIELWLDKRQLAALEQALAEDGTTVDRIMQERLDELYAQRVPPEQQEKIQQELDAEQLESQRSVEANTRYAGFHITENGQEHYLSTKSGQEFLDMALLMRRYPNCPHRFLNGRCVNCYWDGSKSEYIKSLKRD